MILTGHEIKWAEASGALHIDPFDASCLNPNSYNVHLSPLLRAGDGAELEFSEAGFLLEPRRLYFGSTVERFGSQSLVPTLISRSSLARLGLFVHLNADMGNTGAVHGWTLELLCVQPLRIYPLMRVAQISFWVTHGDTVVYPGTYARQDHPRTSRYAIPQMSRNGEPLWGKS